MKLPHIPPSSWLLWRKTRNDDLDDQEDEDGANDLDGNGFITQMRVKDPQGTWIPVPGDPGLLKKANTQKGDKGIYKLYTEGTDDDGDGKYNEDGLEIYGRYFIDSRYAASGGIAGYVYDEDHAKTDRRSGPHPYFTSALKL
jgi:hypothetical protein